METHWLLFTKHFKKKLRPSTKKGPMGLSEEEFERGSSDFEVGKRPPREYLENEEKRARELFEAGNAPRLLATRLSRFKTFVLTHRRMARYLLSYEDMRESCFWKSAWSGSNFQIESQQIANSGQQMENSTSRRGHQIANFTQLIEEFQLKLNTTPTSSHLSPHIAQDTELLAIGTTLSGHIELRGMDFHQEQLIAILPWPLCGAPHPLSYSYRVKLLKPNGSMRSDPKVDEAEAKEGAEDDEDDLDEERSLLALDELPSFYQTMKWDQMPSPTLGLPGALFLSPAVGYRDRPNDFTWLHGLWPLSYNEVSPLPERLLPTHRIMCITHGTDVQLWRISMKANWAPKNPSPSVNTFTRPEYATLNLFDGKDGQTVADACSVDVTPLEASMLCTFTVLPDSEINKLIAWTHPENPSRQCLIMAHENGKVSCVSISLSDDDTSASPRSITPDWYDKDFRNTIVVEKEFGFQVGEKSKKRASAAALRPSRLLSHLPISSISVVAVPADRTFENAEEKLQEPFVFDGVSFGSSSTTARPASSQPSSTSTSGKSSLKWQTALLLTVSSTVLAIDLCAAMSAYKALAESSTERMDVDTDAADATEGGSDQSAQSVFPCPLVAPFCLASAHVMAITDLHAYCLPVEVGPELGAQNGSSGASTAPASLFSNLRPFTTPIQGLTTGMDGYCRGWRMEPQGELLAASVNAASANHPSRLLANSLYPSARNTGATQPGEWKFIVLNESDTRTLVEDDDSGGVHSEELDDDTSADKERSKAKERQNQSSQPSAPAPSGGSVFTFSNMPTTQQSGVEKTRARDLKRMIAGEEWPPKKNANERGFLLSTRDTGGLNALIGLHVTPRASYALLLAATIGRASGNFGALMFARIDSPSSPPPILPLISSRPLPSSNISSTLHLLQSDASIEAASLLRSEPLQTVIRSISVLLSPLTTSQILNIPAGSDTSSSASGEIRLPTMPSDKGLKASDFYRLVLPTLLRDMFPLSASTRNVTVYWNDFLWDRVAMSSRVLTEWLRQRISSLPLEKVEPPTNGRYSSSCPTQRVLEACGIAIGELTVNGKKKKRKMGFINPRKSLGSSGNLRSSKGLKTPSKGGDSNASYDAEEENSDSSFPRPLLSALILLSLRLRALCLLRHICTSLGAFTKLHATPEKTNAKSSSASSPLSFPASVVSSKQLKNISNTERHVLAHWAVLAQNLALSPLWLDENKLDDDEATNERKNLLPTFVQSLGGDILKVLQASLPASSAAATTLKTLDSLSKAKLRGFEESIGIIGGDEGLRRKLQVAEVAPPAGLAADSLSLLLPLEEPMSCSLCLNRSPESSPNGSVAVESASALSTLFAQPHSSFLDAWCPHDGARLAYCASSGLGLRGPGLEEPEPAVKVSKECPICAAPLLCHAPTSPLSKWVSSQCPFCLV